MGNHKLEHHWSHVNTTPSIVLEMTVVEIQKHVKVGVTQSLDVGTTTIGVEIVVMSNIDVVKRGILIRFIAKLGSGSNGILTRRNLSQSLTLPTTSTRVVSTLQMVFTNPIMTTHVNRIIDRPLMNSMVIGKYKNANATNPRNGYQEPSTITISILDHRYGHFVMPNKVALKYLDFKKDVDPNAHVKVFNFVVKVNAEIYEEYIAPMCLTIH